MHEAADKVGAGSRCKKVWESVSRIGRGTWQDDVW